MLNRIYIVVGMLAILVLAGAFIAPRFIQWSDYRDRMEELASGVLGAEVAIRGEISFSLLPTPRLEFSDVVVGNIESPAATVQAVEAEFALVDFLRDNYTVTALVLNQPRVDLVLDESGLFSSGLAIGGSSSGVALDQARINNGSVRLTDLRSEAVITASRIDGDFRLSSFAGPFQFQGFADYGDYRYDVRFSTGPSDAEGVAQLSSSLREVGNAYSISAQGLLTSGLAPKFDGTLTYRQTPPRVEDADDIRGDLVLESTLTASTDRAVLSGFTLMPDENRAGTRLTGAASVQFGARNVFDAVVSGGVFSLPPRDATEVPGELPFEFVRMLSEFPAPPVPPIPGRLGIDLAEAGLRGFALREIRVDATTDGQTWQIEQAVANLPGETEIRLSGTVSNEAGALGFAGDLSVSAQRLDALSALWRRAEENNPLFNLPGTLDGRVMLAGGALGLSDGRFGFAGGEHGVEVRIGFGTEPRLDVIAQLAALDQTQTAALGALMPDLHDTSFAISFPDGSLTLSAEALDVLGLPAADLVAEAQWSPEGLAFSRIAARDWGGLGVDASARLAGTLLEPRITGSGDLSVAAGETPGLEVLYELAAVPFGWQQAAARAWPADLQFVLTDDNSGNGQVLTLDGTLAGAAFDLRLETVNALAQAADGDLRLISSLEGNDAGALQDLLGFGGARLLAGAEPMVASLFVEGSTASGFEGRAALSQANQSISFFGNLALAETGVVSGDGTLEMALAAGNGLPALAGASGASIGAVDATAAIRFDGTRAMTLSGISAAIGDAGVQGSLEMARSGSMPSFSGSLQTDALDAGGLASALFGLEALLGVADGPWPEGPLATADLPRRTRGDLDIAAGRITANGRDILGRTQLNYFWDQESIGLRDLVAQVGGGTLQLDLAQCCAGALSDRTVTGRVSVSGVNIDALVPPSIASGLSGIVQAGLQFEGTGQSLADVMRTMTGEGNFSIADFVATGLSPAVFPAIAAIEDPLNTEAEALEVLVGLGLAQGDFAAEVAQGAFSIAGGTARLANLIVEGNGGQLAGSLNVALARLGLDGSFVLTPRDFTDSSGLVQPDTARILARIAGTLASPEITVDLAEMVAAIQVRANELEVDRLETLRIEDETRQRAAAEARNRLIEAQQRQRAEEEAARLAEEESARLAEEEAARQLEEEQAPVTPTPPALTPGAFDYVPPVNQPFGNRVNQPVQSIPQG